MPTGTITTIANIAGIAINSTLQRTGGGQEAHKLPLPAGTAGTLTTRTDDDTGVATLTAGHGLETSDKVDIYWSGGKQVGHTATVAGDAITIDGGSGDNLPAQDTAVIVTKRVPLPDIGFDGDSMEMLVINCDQRAAIDFETDVPASLAVLEVVAANEHYQWAADQGVSTPITGAPVAQAQCSNGSETAAILNIGIILTT